jgi:hypothetical protein
MTGSIPSSPQPGSPHPGATVAHGAARLLRRGPWEAAAVVVIAAGVVMLMQPFSLTLYTWSFLTTLTGTVAFMIVSKFRD